MAELTYFRTTGSCPRCEHRGDIWVASKLGSRGATYRVGDCPGADIPLVDFEDTSLRVKTPAPDTPIHVLLSSTCESCKLENFAEVVFGDDRVAAIDLIRLDLASLERIHYIGEIVSDMLESILDASLYDANGVRPDWLDKLRAALETRG